VCQDKCDKAGWRRVEEGGWRRVEEGGWRREGGGGRAGEDFERLK